MITQDDIVKNYLREIGRKGGHKSRRQLSSEQARKMVAVREARKAFHEHKTDCFWSFDPEWKIDGSAIPLVVKTLKDEGNRAAFETARRIQRLWRP
jgi:hypothetical protein